MSVAARSIARCLPAETDLQDCLAPDGSELASWIDRFSRTLTVLLLHGEVRKDL